jgi:hypothetical protein
MNHGFANIAAVRALAMPKATQHFTMKEGTMVKHKVALSRTSVIFAVLTRPDILSKPASHIKTTFAACA